MSDHFCAVAFTLAVEPSEATLLKECLPLCETLDFLTYDKDVGAINRAYEKTSDAFKNAFPKRDGDQDPFTAFRKLFDDPQCPVFGVDIEIDTDDRTVTFTSKRAEIGSIANLIRVTCPSALPSGFTFSTYSDGNDEGSANGGYIVIRPERIETTWADTLMRQQLAPNAPFYRIFERDIRQDLTQIVKEVARSDHASNPLVEKARALLAPHWDYDGAAKDNGWVFADGLWRGYNWDEFGSWQEAENAGRCTSYRTAANVCAANDLTPEIHADIECYGVSNWFAQRLIERGERVDPDFGGLPVWAFVKHELAMSDVLEKLAAPV